MNAKSTSRRKQRVLICTDWFSPGMRAGGPIRSCVNLVNCISSELRLSILTGDRDLGSQSPYLGTRPGRWNNWQNKASVLYASRKQHTLGAFYRTLTRLRPQVVYLNSMFSLFGTLTPLFIITFTRSNAKVVLAPRGMLKSTALANRLYRKSIALFLLRCLRIQHRIHFHATSIDEADEIQTHFPGATTTVLPNIPVSPLKQLAVQQEAKKTGSVRLVFVGRVHPIKNLHLVLEFLEQADCQSELNVIGPSEDVNYDQHCRRLATKIEHKCQVRFHDACSPDETLQWMRNSDCLILPTEGENFGHAIFESLAMGTPVLISNRTIWRNLPEASAGWDHQLEDPQSFIESIEFLASMTEIQHSEWRKGALLFAQKYFHAKHFSDQYIELLRAEDG